MFGYDTRLSMPWKDYFRRSDKDELDDIEGKIANNRERMDQSSYGERIWHEERILDLEERREQIRFNASEREFEERGRMEEELNEKDRRIEELESRLDHCEREDNEEDW